MNLQMSAEEILYMIINRLDGLYNWLEQNKGKRGFSQNITSAENKILAYRDMYYAITGQEYVKK